jgi:hypothetical protein
VTQEEYISILFDDCGFNAAQRKDYLLTRFKRPFADELNWREKSQVIEDLKARKPGGKIYDDRDENDPDS